MKVFVYKEEGDAHGDVWKLYQIVRGVVGPTKVYVLGERDYEIIRSQIRGPELDPAMDPALQHCDDSRGTSGHLFARQAGRCLCGKMRNL